MSNSQLQALAERRLAYLNAFLDRRELTADRVQALLGPRLGDAEHLLMTSSPVQGLANAFSDIDCIGVDRSLSASGPRLASQIFSEDQHFELIAFSPTQVRIAIDDLVHAATLPPSETLAQIRAFNATHEMRTKYLERLINGVTLDGRMPYGVHLDALSRVWSLGSFDRARRAGVFGRLAARAGQPRAAVGYGLNAFLYSIDALMSSWGDVFSNKKWFVQRWQRWMAAPSRPPESDPVVASLQAWQARIEQGQSLSAGSWGEVRAALAHTLGVRDVTPVRLELRAEARVVAFLPGASMVLDGERITPVSAPPSSQHLDDEAQIDALDPATASALLAGCRAGWAHCEVVHVAA